MRIGNVTIDGPIVETMVVPYEGKEIVFKARTVLSKDFEDFNKVCPQPEPPTVIKPGGVTSKDIDDPVYDKELTKWAKMKTSWMTLKSLEPSDIGWLTVNISDPSTWGNYENELESLIGEFHTSRVIDLVYTACGMNDRKIKEATDRFLASQAVTPEG